MPARIPATFSFVSLAEMLSVLSASAWVFASLTRRWTRDRPRAALDQWASDRGFKIAREVKQLPESLSALGRLEPVFEAALVRGPVQLYRVSTLSPGGGGLTRWNLLVRTTGRAIAPAGLRPVAGKVSVIDLFALNPYPAELTPDRFVVYATQTPDARWLVSTPSRGLLPADVGLLLHGPYLTLDFTSRPFDGIEFDRMLVIAEQIFAHLT